MAIQLEPLKHIKNSTLEVKSDSIIHNDPNYCIHYLKHHIVNLNIRGLKELESINLYKYYPIDKLAYILEDESLFMDKVQSWDDSYENYLLQCKYKRNDSNTDIDIKNLTTNVFGQCWTTKKNSEAMWEIYSPQKNSVQIKTNAKKLFDVIYIDDDCMANTWFGKVGYTKCMSEIIDKKMSDFLSKQTSLCEIFQKYFPETEFIKRDIFEYESEYRAIFILDSEKTMEFMKNKSERLSFKINLNDFIEQYCLDPRLKNYEFEALKEKLINLGADENKIIKSDLHQIKPCTFNVNI